MESIKRKITEAGKSELGCVGLLIVLAFNMLIGGFTTQYCLNHWVLAIKGSAPHIAMWPWCVVIGLFAGQFFTPAAIVTWVLVILGVIA